jgi:hypothetical protein
MGLPEVERLTSQLKGNGRDASVLRAIAQVLNTPAWLTDLRKQFVSLMKAPSWDALVELRRIDGEWRNTIDMALVAVLAGSFMRGDESVGAAMSGRRVPVAGRQPSCAGSQQCRRNGRS